MKKGGGPPLTLAALRPLDVGSLAVGDVTVASPFVQWSPTLSGHLVRCMEEDASASYYLLLRISGYNACVYDDPLASLSRTQHEAWLRTVCIKIGHDCMSDYNRCRILRAFVRTKP